MRGGLDQPDVERVLGDAVLDRLGVGDGELRLHLGVQRLELAEHPRQQELRDRGARADQQRPGQPAGHLAEPRIELGGEGEDPLGILEHHPARRGERNLAVAALEETRVEVLLELLDLKGDRGLGHEQRLGRLREAHLLRNGVEYLEPAIGHGEQRAR